MGFHNAISTKQKAVNSENRETHTLSGFTSQRGSAVFTLEHLQKAQKISNIGSWEYDLRNGYVLWSQQMYSIYGVDERSFVPTMDNHFKLVHPDDRALCERTFRQFIETGETCLRFEHRILKRGIEERIVLHRLEPERDETGIHYLLIGTTQDITEMRYIEDQLAESKEQFHSVADHLPEGIWSFDMRKRKMTYCSHGLKEIYGISADEFRKNPGSWLDFVYTEDRPIVEGNIHALFGVEAYNTEFRIVDTNKKRKWVSLRTIPFLDSHGQLLRVDGVIRDITDEKEYTESLARMAFYDYLTGLPNRIHFDNKLRDHIANAKASERKFAIFCLDIDRFEYINDTLGHSIGDQLLIAVSKRLQHLLDDNTTLARIAGGEFAVVLDKITMVEEAMTIARKLIKEMGEPFFVEDYELFVTSSIGISFFPVDGEDSVTLLKNANHALRKVKDLGRNDWQIYSPSMNIGSYKSFRLESDLYKAVSNQEFFLVYQPKVDARLGRIMGAEALIRWRHPNWGVISPGVFIPIAEENGVIFEMGDWVLREVCKLLGQWKKHSVPLVPIAINVSPKRILKADFVNSIKETILSTNIEPGLIELELTESAIIKNIEKTKQVISELKDFGVRFALDDFGTGYSSLSHLMDLDIDTLKIDKSFIDGIGVNKANEGIIKGTLFLGRELNIPVVAEGVEKHEQLQFLRQNGCPEIQGYIFSKPVHETEFRKLLTQGGIDAAPPKSVHSPIKNRRKYFRLKLDFPLGAEMTVIKINNKDVKLGTSKTLIEDISLGGLRFLSNINLPIRGDFTLRFTTVIFKERVQFIGKNVWKTEVNGLFRYGFEFIMTERERDQFAAILNQLTLKLKSNPLVEGCRFWQGNKVEYFKGEK